MPQLAHWRSNANHVWDVGTLTWVRMTQPGEGGAGGGLSDAELRATPVPVSGTVTINEPVTVDAVDLDIRNLAFAADKVDASGSTGVGVTGTFFQATQPVSAASLPLPTGAATLAGQTQPGVDIGDVTVNNATGAAAVNVQDGGNSLTVDGVFFQATQPVSLATAPTTPVTGTFWQATQPVSAATLPLPTGAATLAGQTQPGVDIGDVTVNNAAGGAAVNIQDGGNTITVDGAVTTSGTVTEANSGAIAASLSVVDDWDETDRAKVNLVVGQAGVPAGGGTEATSLRVTLANDSTGLVSVDDNGGSLTVDGIAVNPSSGEGKTLLFAKITQSVAGTNQLVAADVTRKIKVVSYVFTLSATGTVKFLDGVGDLTGLMTFSATGGAGAVNQPSSHILETAVNSALSITSTVGAANGHISYFLEA